MKFTHFVRTLLVSMSLGALVLSTGISATAAPSPPPSTPTTPGTESVGRPFDLRCPSVVRRGFSVTCTFAATEAESYRVRASNTAVDVPATAFASPRARGRIVVGGRRLGGVTISVFSSDGFTRTSDRIEVIR